RLPLVAIKNKQTIGECELFTKYFDPILASLFSDPDRKVLLRWSNVMSDENDKIRPDATISKLRQRDFGPSLGYGEVKVARPTIDNHALCHDLMRLATLARDTIDTNALEAALTFQVHGFHITFFLTRLRHDGINVMQEVAQLTFPRFLEELATFVSLKNMRTLM
ncbi:hypothetical protein BDB00DRAFT_744001, partial [Zychaea mexicana]|uniref:uncharacterized protein n=1 Tax=Zychaea mexicana TaxID=64656 RepID=UPI0022FEF6FC